MKSRKLQVVVAIAGLAAVVIGISQILAGADELKSPPTLTKGDAREVANRAVASLKEHVDEERGIAFSYPKDWTTERPTGSPVFFKWKTLKGLVNGSAMSEELPAGMTLVEYVKLNREQIAAQLTKDKMAPEGFNQDEVQVGPEQAFRLRYGCVLPDSKQQVRYTQTFFIHGNRAYGICLTTTAEVHETFDTLMAKILASVRFLG